MRLAFLLVGSTIADFANPDWLSYLNDGTLWVFLVRLHVLLNDVDTFNSTLFSVGWVAVTLPVLPLYLPARTMTVSPLFRGGFL